MDAGKDEGFGGGGGVWGAEGVQSQLDGVTRNKAIFQKIASALADLGYTRTWQQCKTFIISGFTRLKIVTRQARDIKIKLLRSACAAPRERAILNYQIYKSGQDRSRSNLASGEPDPIQIRIRSSADGP